MRERDWERESEREREREREKRERESRERERERKRERERLNTTLHLDGESLTKRQKSGKKIYPTIFPVCWLLSHLSRFFTGISSQQICDTTSPMFIMGNLFPSWGINEFGIFPPKSKILFVLSLALIWCRNFQDRTIPVGGDTWTSFWRKERRITSAKYVIRTRYTSARQYVMPCESGRRSRDHRPTVKQRFFDVSSN